MAMNLQHRVVDNRYLTQLDMVMKRIAYPLNFLIPLGLTLISLYNIRDYFGTSFELGNFSTGFWSWVAGQIAGFVHTDSQVILSTIVLLCYALGPLTAYLFVYQLTERHLPAIITATLIQLPAFPFSGMPPIQLSLALIDGDAAHVAALSFMPLAALAFLDYLRSKNITQILVFTAISAFMASLSFFSIYVLAIVMVFITISEVLIDQGRIKIRRALSCVGVVTLTAFLVYNISLWNILTSQEGQNTIRVFLNFIPLSFFLLPILGIFFFLIFDRRPKLQPVFLSLSLTILFWLFHWIRVSFVDIPLFDQDRYRAELAFGRSFAAGVLSTILFDLGRAGVLFPKLNLSKERRLWLSFAVMTVMILSLIASLLFIPRSI